jgi:hypothetical protein
MALTISYTPGYVWQPGELVTIAKLNLAANPTMELDGSITSTSIGAGAVGPSQLNVSVAGGGLQGGGGQPLSVATDSTLNIIDNLLGIAAASITLDKLRIGGFTGASAFMSGIPGLVPAPAAGQDAYGLRGDGTWYDFTAAAKAIYQPAPVEIAKAMSFC